MVNAVKPVDLFKECSARERRLLDDAKSLRSTFYRILFLDRNIFPQSMTTPEGAEGLDPKERDILDKGLLGDRCRAVFGLLNQTRNIYERCELLSRWLKYEGVKNPEELPRLTTSSLASHRLRGISLASIKYAAAVEIWGPYFKRLSDEIRAKGGVIDPVKLNSAGYDGDAVTHYAAHQKIIPAICDWLAEREIFGRQVDARTIRNAHTRLFGGRFRQTSFF
jgi:hypothetical protein